MSKSTKIVLTVVIIIVVAGILWYVGLGKRSANAPGSNASSSATSGLSTADSDASN
jgi:flagellar basal body-associated protein FliL